MLDQNQILLQTKLHRPRVPKDLLQRSRLVELLDDAIDHQLILVCAPAGFGKTTLVGAWLEGMAAGQREKGTALPSAWLSLDEDDSDLDVFLRYFIAALRTIFKEACEESLALLRARQLPPQAVLYATFCNELAKLPGEAILVLDDYHTVRGAGVQDLLGELARHWPRGLHLVVISRTSPPIPLDRLRAKGMMREIRTRDLRFTLEETQAYLSHSQFALMVREALPLLEERFEGWPAGLHLAALSLRSKGSQAAVLSALSSENPNITGYLLDEVLTHQIPAIRSFLLKTSILDRYCASLCEAIVGETDAAWNVRACLDLIERSELFITPLDDRQEWYRYHHLFQQFLQQRLSAEMAPDHVTNLHFRASAWFEEHGLLDEALHHALAAGDLDLAARQMIAGLREVVNREDRPTLERWLRLLPQEMIQRSPGLLMIRVWALEFSWRLNPQAQVLRQVEALLDAGANSSLPAEDLQTLRGQVLALKGQQAYFGNRPTQAVDYCREALALLPPAWTFVRGGAMLFLGMAMQAGGQGPEAEGLLLDEYESYAAKADPYALLLLRSLGFNYLNSGQLEQSRQIAQVLLHGATISGVAIMKNWGDYYPGVVHYHRNELQAAAEYFSQIVENRYTAQITAYRDAVAGLALIHQIRGESAEALQMVEAMSQFDLEQRGVEDERTRSLRARLMLLQGDLEAAGNWADTFSEPPPDQSLLWLEEPQVTRARVLVARGTNADLGVALGILDVLDEIAGRTHNIPRRIEVLALRAMALEAQRRGREAEAALNKATALARQGGFVRVFVDLGQPLRAILARLEGRSPTGDHVHRLLAAFPDQGGKGGNGRVPIPPLTGPAHALTVRETDVLKLLREPLAIKEIADQLSLALSTVKRHIANIYSKLDVNRRWDAVAKAEELNILPPR